MNIKYKLIISLGAIVLLAAACNKTSPKAPSASNAQPPVSQSPNQSNQSSQATQNQQNVVTYTDAGFSPASLTVKKGDTVIFKDSASDDVRVSSNPHPIHNGYPTTGGCVSSTFDSCTNVPPAQSWSFKFDLVGSWVYHNHLNPSEGGTIIVQ